MSMLYCCALQQVSPDRDRQGDHCLSAVPHNVCRTGAGSWLAPSAVKDKSTIWMTCHNAIPTPQRIFTASRAISRKEQVRTGRQIGQRQAMCQSIDCRPFEILSPDGVDPASLQMLALTTDKAGACWHHSLRGDSHWKLSSLNREMERTSGKLLPNSHSPRSGTGGGG